MTNKNPYRGLMEMSKLTYENDKKSLEYFFDYTDKFITWLIGFGVAGISLILANLEKLNSTIPYKWVVLLLSLTIIFGLLYRLIAYLYLTKMKGLENYFAGFFGDLEVWPVVAEDISNATYEEVINLIGDFDEKPESLEKMKGDDLGDLKEYYLSLIEHSKKFFYIGANALALTYEEAFKIKQKKTIELLEMSFGLRQAKGNIIGFNARMWGRAINLFFTLSIISFLTCSVIVCLSFFIKF